MCTKGDLVKIHELIESNEATQLGLWGPINYLNDSKKNVVSAADLFSRWASAMVCNANCSDKYLKFLNFYIKNYGVLRKIRVDFVLTKKFKS